MKLIADLVGWALKKVGLIALMLVGTFLAYLAIQTLVPAVKSAVTDRDRLPQVVQERAAAEADLAQLKRTAEASRTQALGDLKASVEAEIASGRTKIVEQRAVVGARRKESDECGLVRETIEKLPFVPNKCEAKRLAAKAAQEFQDTLERNLAAAEAELAILSDPSLSNQEKLARLGDSGTANSVDREIDEQQTLIDQKKAEEQHLREVQGSGLGWVVDQWFKSWGWMLTVVLIAIFTPALIRLLSYYLLMPLVTRISKPIHLADGADEVDAGIRAGQAARTLKIDLSPGEVLSARSHYVRPVGGKVESVLLYRWRAPFLSYAAGLRELSQVTGDEGVTSAQLTAPGDPDAYLMRIDFRNHPGLVMHPRHVVGIIGSPRLETRWRWGIQAFAKWQVRYILFAGAGSLIVEGCGDVAVTNPQGRVAKIDEHLLMGFDSRLGASVARGEVFWQYLRGRAPLVLDAFTGDHPYFWQKANMAGPKNPIAKTFDVFFSAIGKILGF